MEDNVSIVRDKHGNMSVWVAGNKVHGQKNVQLILNPEGFTTVVMGIPLSHCVFAEGKPDEPVFETKDNVIYAFGTERPPVDVA